MTKEVELMQTHGIVKCKSVWPVVSYLKRAVCDSRCFEAESKTFQSEREPSKTKGTFPLTPTWMSDHVTLF